MDRISKDKNYKKKRPHRLDVYLCKLFEVKNVFVIDFFFFFNFQMAPSSGDHSKDVPSLSTRTSKHQPTMGLLDAINLLLACIIGSGIFISAKAVLEYSGSYGLSIVVWIGCGLLCIMVKKLFHRSKN